MIWVYLFLQKNGLFLLHKSSNIAFFINPITK